jgi:DNA-binding response OmpR family regulator
LRDSGCAILTKPFPIDEIVKAVQAALAAPVPSVAKS